MFVCVRAYVRAYVCMRVYVFACLGRVYAYVYVTVYVYVYVTVYVYVCVCVRVRVCACVFRPLYFLCIRVFFETRRRNFPSICINETATAKL